ncbi:hypothetical protein [Streptomyces sp. SID13726]|uniref:hypothetical protein n=1 Tax=Streptomyces sp. SID13726 TaxID=2706058 RepID=UPI0013B8CDB2|nr:hypothetical protein [Streptomyces sp. SID13726]NEB00640.1 hypothetical protein [Streptomyces sp. SID13726]
MDSDQTPRLSLVETGPEVPVVTSAERRLAVEHWLLSTLPGPGRDRARMEWQEQEWALLPLGTLFAAVRLPERVVHAVARTDNPLMVDEFLAAALDDNPVIHDPLGHRFYALVPASMPRRYGPAAQEWRDYGVEILGSDAFLGVPRVDAEVLDTRTQASYWAVPMPSAAMLCEPLAVARLLAAAARRLGAEPDA